MPTAEALGLGVKVVEGLGEWFREIPMEVDVSIATKALAVSSNLADPGAN